jgi:hypothetical protein
MNVPVASDGTSELAASLTMTFMGTCRIDIAQIL